MACLSSASGQRAALMRSAASTNAARKQPRAGVVPRASGMKESGSGHLSTVTTSPQRPHPSARPLPPANFKPSNRSIEDLTSAPEFTSTGTTRTGPLLVSVDHTPEAARALDWVLHNLCFPGEEGEKVELVHVVCDPRALNIATSASAAASARVRLLDSSDLNDAFQDYSTQLLKRAEGQVKTTIAPLVDSTSIPTQLHLPRLPGPRSAAMIGEVLLQEAERLGARALVVASHGPGAMVEYGSVARYCYQHASLPLVLIPGTHKAGFFGTASFRTRNAQEEATTQAAHATPSPAVPPALLPASARPVAQTPGDADAVTAAPPATAAHVPLPGSAPPDSSVEEAVAAAGLRRLLLVVSHLPELEAHWQWVADNLCRHGDVLDIWHLQQEGEATQSKDGNLASLPTALTQVLKSRGLADVRYSVVYSSGDPTEVAKKVCGEAEQAHGPRMVVVLNYARQGMLREAVQGSVASSLSRHCPVPLVLLEPPMGV